MQVQLDVPHVPYSVHVSPEQVVEAVLPCFLLVLCNTDQVLQIDMDIVSKHK